MVIDGVYLDYNACFIASKSAIQSHCCYFFQKNGKIYPWLNKAVEDESLDLCAGM